MNERDALHRVAKLVALLRYGSEFQMNVHDAKALEVVLEMATNAFVASVTPPAKS